MMNKLVDLSGQRIGRLTIISRASENTKDNRPRWRCLCDCGQEKILSRYQLRKAKSCGCGKAFKDLKGMNFGWLTVLEFLGKNVHGHSTWRCRCECGEIREVTSSNLLGKITKSCGRCARINPQNNKGGKRMTANGYVELTMPEHPNARGRNGCVFEHVVVMSNMIGRPLTSKETVHHKNGIRDDNRPENLELWTSDHPSGQRAADLLEFADQIIEKYGELRDVLLGVRQNSTSLNLGGPAMDNLVFDAAITQANDIGE